ncbi:hypothetical protein SDC9_139563 [bioreactor metagenome]|uniref:Uncharacterized protein n=1 Tax=bioreactor metagenome TaxID=1076179 RepID=A0A645DTG6_9ZZZZ
MGTINDNFQTAKVQIVRKGALAKLNVTTTSILDALHPPQFGRRRTDHGLIDPSLDCLLHLIRQFGTLC